jgi:electron transport complex protein RnfD
MANMLVALAPVTVFGVVAFGLAALLNIVVAVVTAEVAELVFRKLTHQDLRNGDLSAAVSGLLLALVLPPSLPLWMTALGAVFSIIVAKEFFGGLGANVFNPALAGRAFLLMSFPAAVTTWLVPGAGFLNGMGADAVTGATALVNVKLGTPLPSLTALFFGWRGGCTGETSILLILAAFVWLVATKTIDWRAPVAMVVVCVLLSFPMGYNPLITLLTGGLMFGAVFMTTDYTTAPVTPWGRLVFGAGCGVITMLIRRFGAYPEGVSYSILIMNMATPFLDRLVGRKFGYGRR